jgi:hypothetical protein
MGNATDEISAEKLRRNIFSIFMECDLDAARCGKSFVSEVMRARLGVFTNMARTSVTVYLGNVAKPFLGE